MDNSIVAIITARGGSKGVPGKNIRSIGGKPLIAHTVTAALQCPLLNSCYVSTEDSKISDISREFGSKVIDRPLELAGDTIHSAPVVEHALRYLHSIGEHYPYFVLLQPTSPLRNAQHISDCLKILINSTVDSVVSVTESAHHPFKTLLETAGKLEPLVDAETLELPRQQLPKAYFINGAIFAMRTEAFFREKMFLVSPYKICMMSPEESIDIDTELDFLLCEIMMKNSSVDG